MQGRVCHPCYEKMMENLRRSTNNDKNLSMDINECTFACKMPLYGSDEMGRPMVTIWDCVQKITLTYSNEEWERKKREGEFET